MTIRGNTLPESAREHEYGGEVYDVYLERQPFQLPVALGTEMVCTTPAADLKSDVPSDGM